MRQCVLKDIHFFEDRDLCFSQRYAHCSKFQLRIWHGIFMVFPREIKSVLLTRFLSRFYKLPLLGCGPVQSFATTWSNCESTYFPPLPKWALNQLKPRFLCMLVSYCGSKNSGFYLTEVPFVASKRAAIRMFVCQVPNTSHQEKWP